MDRTAVLAGAAGLLALSLLTVTGVRVHAADRRELDELRASLAALRAAAAKEPAPAPAAGPPEAELSAVLAGLEDLRARLARLEASAARVPVAPVAAEPAPARPGPALEDPRGRRKELGALIDELVGAGWDFDGREDAMERFLALAREEGLLDELLSELEDDVAASPGNTELRMRLADHYVAKLMTVGGPEQGLWGGRAEEQWQAVVELDDGHWGAHARLGTNYSFYPSVMGRTDDAIRHLERARELQGSLPAAAEHVQTYLYLARLLAREGERERARAVLEEGRARHPGERALERALAELGG
jgi:tetratricopeptide (TPR) repeat protein